jgi:integrase
MTLMPVEQVKAVTWPSGVVRSLLVKMNEAILRWCPVSKLSRSARSHSISADSDFCEFVGVGTLAPRKQGRPRRAIGEMCRYRAFCIRNGLPSVRFHALRACFATQLISSGIPASVVMKICGWKDLKTMQRYIRLAGIDEAGATEILRFVPTEEAVMEKVVSMYDHRRKD